MAICERAIYQHTWLGEVPGPEGNRHPLICPFGMFPAADGHVAVAVMHDHFWGLLAEAMGVPEAGADPRYATNRARVQHRDEVDGMIADWTARHSKAELKSLLGGGCRSGRSTRPRRSSTTRTWRRAACLPRPSIRGARTSRGRIANTPLRFGELGAGVRARAPLLGETQTRS